MREHKIRECYDFWVNVIQRLQHEALMKLKYVRDRRCLRGCVFGKGGLFGEERAMSPAPHTKWQPRII